MSSLGKIILKTLESFYPHTNIKIRTEDIDSILQKANINKNNSKKEDIAKIIKILKHHIEMGINSKKDNLEEKKYEPVFKSMDQENNFLENMKLEYIDNFNKLKEQDLNFEPEKRDIIPPELRVKEFMEEKEMEFEHYILIDSKDRNITKYPNPCDYSIKLGVSDQEVEGSVNRNFEEVISIELVDFILKDTNSVNNATDKDNTPPYLLLDIEECGTNMFGTNDFINKAFGKLSYYDMSGEGSSGDKYRHYTVERGKIIKFFKPRKNINRLSIKIRNFNGDIYSFGDSTDDGTVSLNSLTFCIKTLQKNFVSNFIDKT